MAEIVTEYRKYLDPRTLARISSLDLRGPADREGFDDRHAPLAVSRCGPVEFAQHRP
jgi:hypothetical protein